VTSSVNVCIRRYTPWLAESTFIFAAIW